MFWTGYPCFPSNAGTKLKVEYLAHDDSKVMAEAKTCSYSMSIPTVHASFGLFRDFMDKTIAFGKRGFGKM